MCFGFNKVQAIDSVFDETSLTRNNLQSVAASNSLRSTNTSTTLGISKTRRTGNYYSWGNNTTADAKNVWKIANYSSGNADYSNLYYCLNAERGFGTSQGRMAEGATDEYTTEYEVNDTNKNNIISIAGGSLGTNYNKILWILDNSYIPTGSSSYKTSAEYINFKTRTGLNYDLTEEQIEVVQQMAIWYYTNNSYEDPTENRGNLPNLYCNGEQTSAIPIPDDYGDRVMLYNVLNELYQYFITGANANSSYTHKVPTLSLSNAQATVTESGDYFIAGPFNLSGTNTDLITQINATITPNKSYTLLNSSKNVVSGNDFTNVIGNNFYLRFNKSDISNDTTFNIKLNYKYNIRNLTVMTDITDVSNTQPVVLIEPGGRDKDIETSIEIQLRGSYDLVLVKEDENGEDLNSTATFEVNGQTKTVTGRLTVADDVQITRQNVGTADVYTIKELVPPDEYCKFDGTITVTVNKSESNGKYIASNVQYTVTGGNASDVNVYLRNGNIYVEVKNYPEEDPVYSDLALRKYITKIGEQTIDNRTPQVSDTDKLDIDDASNHTARYTHPKNALQVKKGDFVEYSITVYNEGKIAARASKITDQIPNGLKFVEVVSGNYQKESYDENTNRLVLKETSSNSDLGIFEKGKELKRTTVVVKCEVLNSAQENINLTNIAWISEMKKGNEIFTADIDSQTTNSPDCNKDNMSNYEGKRNDNGYYLGQQDDDDFDRVIIIPEVIPERVNKTVTKVWVDSEDEDQLRTDKIEVQLYKTVEGVKTAVGNKIELKSANRWTYTWENLLKQENGKDIVYSVEEVTVPTGYTVSYSAENYNNVDTITITNTHTVTPPSGNYNVVMKKVDDEGNTLSNAKIKVNGTTYIVGTTNIANNSPITSSDAITLDYAIEEIKAPDGYMGLSTIKNIKVKLTITKIGKTYTVTRAELVDNNGNVITDNDIKVSLNASTSTIIITVVNNEIKPEFDLSLRKFITKVNDTAVNREPVVDTSKLGTLDENGSKITTARYVHSKDPISVQVGDIVTYKIRVYNEGETDGYVAKITDHLPEWLDFLPEDTINKKYLWRIDLNDNRTIFTEIAAKDSATGEEIYSQRPSNQLLKAYNGGEILDYIDVEIRCRVNKNAPTSRLLTNIAEISKMQDAEGTEIITDRDSTKANVNLPTDEDLPNYTRPEDNGYFPGQEDDDDFEKVIVKNFDLSLRKFITQIDNIEYDRAPAVDTSKLGTLDENGKEITTAIYNHPKNSLNVKKGDIITYTLRIYNEGTLPGYATEVFDYIPEGLEFIDNSQSSINQTYGWEVRDGKIVTTYLADKLINGVTEESESKILDYKDVKVQLKVVADPKEFAGEIITNWAEIGEDSNNDIDSTPGNNIKTEDDIDFEPVKLTYFDLALRKFITNANGIDYNNRIPEVDTSKLGTLDENGKKITTFTYNHTKDPVVVTTGSTVIYTIRVYNEGSISGYATELTDNIPEGLEFLPENETNTEYKWKMLDEDGNVTQDVTKAKKITTTYLANEIIDSYQKENGVELLSYKDVKVAFKVTEPNTSNRLVINTAEISKASDEDIDSVPGNNDLTEDDIDREYLKVKYFDLALKKWVTEARVTYNGKTTVTKTGFNEDSTEMAKVDLVSKRLNKTTVKFVYKIKVINEGEVAGYATEVEDYIPAGLKFVEGDNPKWKLIKDDVAVTDQLKDTLLEPGQSATIEIVLTWKNSTSNMGVKTNWAEIKEDSDDDVDSVPDNYKKEEDDIDNAKVILSIKTGSIRTYIFLSLISITILAGGTFAIKKYVLK